MPACSPAKPPSPSAPRARAWSPAISSTRRLASRLLLSPAPSSSATRRSGRRRRRSSSRTRARSRAQGQGRARRRSGRRVRVVSGLRGGAAKSDRLEPPFVGRDRELRLVKELYHAYRRRAPVASRLGRRHRRHRQVAAQLGVLEVHRRARRRPSGGIRDAASPTARALPSGRSPTWCGCAAGIVEDEEAGTAAREASRGSSRSTSSIRTNGDSLEPRLAHLLGLEEGAVGDQENLFAAGALFFERLAESGPDRARLRGHPLGRQRASSTSSSTSLDWSRDRPALRPHALAPELQDRRPTWGSRQAQFHIDLPRATLDRCDGGAPHRTRAWPPEELRERILERAEGVPFYAVETVRMLLDRGAPRPATGRLVPADRASRDARGPGDAAGPDRRPARRRSRRRSVEAFSTPRCSDERSR